MITSPQPHNLISLTEEVDLTRAQNNPTTCQNVDRAFVFEGRVDAEIFAQALTKVAAIYDALRTHFHSPQKDSFSRTVEPPRRVEPQVVEMKGNGPNDAQVTAL